MSNQPCNLVGKSNVHVFLLVYVPWYVDWVVCYSSS